MRDPITIADEFKLLELDKSELVGMIRGLILMLKKSAEKDVFVKGGKLEKSIEVVLQNKTKATQ